MEKELKSPREILDERLARGEISADEYSRLIEVIASRKQPDVPQNTKPDISGTEPQIPKEPPPDSGMKFETSPKQSYAWLWWLAGGIGVLITLMFLGVFNSTEIEKSIPPFEAKFDPKILKQEPVKADIKLRKLLMSASPIEGTIRLDHEMVAESIKLPFYSGVSLVVVTQDWSPKNLRLFFLYDGKRITQLNGKSEPIYKFNATHPLILNENTLAAYLWYFGFFVRAEEGPFFIVNSPIPKAMRFNLDNIKFANPNQKAEDFIRPMTCHITTRSKAYQCDAMVVYASTLFEAKFTVKPDGRVEMTNGKALASILSPKANLYTIPISIHEIKSTFSQAPTSLEQLPNTELDPGNSDPNLHSHGNRTHTHTWPKNTGVKHRHNKGPVGSRLLPE